MLGNDRRGQGFGKLRVARENDGYVATFIDALTEGASDPARRVFQGTELLDWVKACSVADGLALEVASEASFRVGPLPVRGSRSPTLGDLIFPFVCIAPDNPRLYPFQREGIAWLCSKHRAILADDMGLGKTVQVFTALRRVLCTSLGRQALVIAPKILVDNWLRESNAWASDLVVRSVAEIGAGTYRGGAHVVLASYDDFTRNQRLRETKWAVVVADEAHRLRTGSSQRARAFRELNSTYCWLLTGTPIEHSPADLATLLSYLDPVRFSARALLTAPGAVRPTAQPFLLRRRKADVLAELPPLQSRDVILPMTPAQSVKYFDVLLGRDGVSRIYLQKIAQCRSICDFEPESDASAKLDWLEEFLARELPVDEKVVVFSAYLPVLRAAHRRLHQKWPGICRYISGETPSSDRHDSLAAFSGDGSPRVLLLSMGVGAEGLTLTRANHVIFLNEWWNPSLNQQARDRVLRIGQHRPVYEYRLALQGTIEDRIRDIIQRKLVAVEKIVEALAGSPGELELLPPAEA
jgi:SNF2 family DNA or RNA helicase